MSSWAPSTYEGCGSTITMHFCNVNLVDRSTLHLCNHIPSSQKLHSIFVFCFANPTKLLMRPLSCFYWHCVDQDWESCEATLHVPLWWPIKFQPKDTNFVHGQLEVVEELGAREHEDDKENLVVLVCVEDILQF
jgi:hypothetical protein